LNGPGDTAEKGWTFLTTTDEAKAGSWEVGRGQGPRGQQGKSRKEHASTRSPMTVGGKEEVGRQI